LNKTKNNQYLINDARQKFELLHFGKVHIIYNQLFYYFPLHHAPMHIQYQILHTLHFKLTFTFTERLQLEVYLGCLRLVAYSIFD